MQAFSFFMFYVDMFIMKLFWMYLLCTINPLLWNKVFTPQNHICIIKSKIFLTYWLIITYKISAALFPIQTSKEKCSKNMREIKRNFSIFWQITMIGKCLFIGAILHSDVETIYTKFIVFYFWNRSVTLEIP